MDQGESVAFFNLPTVHQPQEVDDPAIHGSLKLASQAPYILAASRIAHCMQLMLRMKIGDHHTRDDIEDVLVRWFRKITSSQAELSPAKRAKHPLRDYRVRVVDRPGRLGQLAVVAFVEPAYQMEEAHVTLRIVTNVTRGGAESVPA